MSPHPTMRAGAAALACALAPAVFAADSPADDLLTGNVRLACEATLCLSSSVRPGECNPSLEKYFSIEIFDDGHLDWGATVDARRAFLAMCPGNSAEGMPARIDAISKGAGKCDPAYLNSAYAGTAYRYRQRGYSYDSNTGTSEPSYEVHELKTVTLNTLPSYCVAYNDHAWTYELSVKYVGTPDKGGRWVKAEDYDAAQAAWNADHGGTWASGWNFSLTDPRRSYSGNNHGGNER
ncbi:TrbM/KikA/MpfK family conjugal transfer protein [Castellaniella denitrificans]|uniref:TrbM/KikA/MpfK family conjugal transfer protein n=1 Tax=Castellaniella denitrificans TaxID=56119 RepID=A0ABT4M303_9BURK|nr:TrbM/KikA/MpfK family conjugal transfer protein [Castellaniella denitrificans]MCZ4328481.1 TrbM/KikA/MpfK family conjugal transfer protein [Castellaniella denitrificans]